jgi:hypothetical protein
MESRKIVNNRLVQLSKIFSPQKIVFKILSANNLYTLNDCAQCGTEALLMIDGIGVATLLTLRGACKKNLIDWRLSGFEKTVEVFDPAYHEWMKNIVKTKQRILKESKKVST